MGLARAVINQQNHFAMATIIMGENGELATTNLSFKEISEILSAKVEEKNAETAKTNETLTDCDFAKKMEETIEEFTLCIFKHPHIGIACVKVGFTPEFVHKSFLRYSIKVGKTLTETFNEIETADDEKSFELLAKILGL